MAGQKWYDRENIDTLQTLLSEKKAIFDQCVSMYSAIDSSITDYTWYKTCPVLPGTGLGDIMRDIQSIDAAGILTRISSIISSDDQDRVPLVKDLESNKQIAESYFQRVQYVSDSITEDPKTLFIPPSGGGWSDYMFNYNMNMLNIDNTDDEALMEVWDYFYNKYSNFCSSDKPEKMSEDDFNSMCPILTIDGFNNYMRREHPEDFENMTNILVLNEVGVNVSNPEQLSAEDITKLRQYLVDMGFTGNIPENTSDLIKFVKAVNIHRATSSAYMAKELDVDSSELFASSKYEFINNAALGTSSTISVNTIMCSYKEKVSDAEAQNGAMPKTIIDVYDSNSDNKANFVNKCSLQNGSIMYGRKEIGVHVSVPKYDELSDIDGIINAESSNYSSVISVEKIDDILNDAKARRNTIRDSLIKDFGVDISVDILLALASGFPGAGQVVGVMGTTITYTTEMVSKMNEFRDAQNQVDKLQRIKDSSEVYSDAGTTIGCIIIDVDGKAKYECKPDDDS